jgi:hypothetical protein
MTSSKQINSAEIAEGKDNLLQHIDNLAPLNQEFLQLSIKQFN